VPKKVDQDARRRDIADALLRLAATAGLEAVSLRHVAAEAGVSMGSVQHYFRTKDDMLEFALAHMEQRREVRIRTRLTSLGRPPTVREVVRTSLVEVLPTDEPSRSDYLAGVAFFIRALREPRMAGVIAEGGPRLHAFFADQLGRAQRAGELVEGLDPWRESVLLWSLVEAQATGIVVGEIGPDDAVGTIDYYLDRIFHPPHPVENDVVVINRPC
jgi:AcrR family transcriptional regulator